MLRLSVAAAETGSAAPRVDPPPPAASGAVQELVPALLETTVNGQRSAEPVLFLQGTEGVLYASADSFARWRMRIPPGSPVRFEGELFYRVSEVPGLRVALSEEDQSVTIDADAAAFARQSATMAVSLDMPMTPPSSGAFLNYDLFAEHVRGRTSVNGAFEVGLFTRRGVATASFIGSAGHGPDRLVRLDTAWTIDRPADATSIRIGDSISSAGPGAAPVRFGGVQYARNFATQPGFITMPLPVASGSAVVPSVVDIYVNNALQSSQELAPGPFELTNIPVQTGGGTVQLVVRDLLGRQMVSEQAYYASSALLRRGLHDFSYEAGFVRRDFGRRSNRYGGFMASTTHRFGLSDRITLEGHAQASEDRQMAGAAVTALLFDLAQIGGAASVSHSERGVGARFAASFEHHSRRLSIGVRGDYTTENYRVIGMSERPAPARYTVQAFADMPIGRGSLGANFLRRSLRGEPDETLAGLFASYPIADRASLQLFARRSVAGRRQTLFGAHVALALGGRRSASASVEHHRRGTSGFLTYQDDVPAGTGGGFRASASFGAIESVEATYIHNFSMASLSAQVSHIEGDTGVRLSATGSVGLIGGSAFASRTLGDSFATVRVENYPGVRVYADNHLVGVTNANGAVTVPALRAFEPNVIRIEETDLPIDALVDTIETTVRPFARTGLSISFTPRRERGVLMRVRLEDGSALPAGARVSIDGRSDSFVAVSGGEVYVPDLTGTATLRAEWGDSRCAFVATVPANDDPQPRLDDLLCHGEAAYAAR